MATTTARATKTPSIIGQKYSRHSFGQVVEATPLMVTVRNEAGKTWDVAREIFDAEFKLSHNFKEERGTNRTELIRIIRENANTVMTIWFRKKQVYADLQRFVYETIFNAYDVRELPEDILTAKGTLSSMKLRNKINELVEGELREMAGRHYNAYDDNGRLQFLEAGVGYRTIDPRTIEAAIIDGVKYVVA